MKENTILIVEDEPTIAETIKMYLLKEGFNVEITGNGNDAIKIFDAVRHVLVLLDLNLPGEDGIKVCRNFRSRSSVPIIMVTARDEEEDKLIGLETGADDYITKPFSIRELVARVKVLLRRAWSPQMKQDRLMVDDIVIERKSMRIWEKGNEIKLTPTEFKLLEVLMENAGQVLTRDQIIEAIYGYSYEGYDRTLDSHVKNIRSKLEENPQKPRYILTVKGVGYQFKRLGL
ncbi:MAG: hypothetical protein A2Y23_14275 [Clostridiales bacterium GWB2_37_7]|nr:MAG: hypothetical protein A2Y23_14275 [Clostridiales bacterium GWB2_37_7]